ncbi:MULTISPECIES: hypothetical protein [Nocardia]|uniref:hypothetical protein n=1 Tax=Nocardia TaxID=1817 RepID=UPI0024549007|nr:MULTISPECIES: hypothetical protein [Nocardia]
MTPVFGYLRIPLIEPARMAAVEAQLAETAAAYGGSLDGRLFAERGCPAPFLWSLLTESDPAAAERLKLLTHERGIALDLLLDATAPTTALWQLMAALEAAGGGHVLIPSPAHLEGTGASKETVQRVISAINGAKIVWVGDEQPLSSDPHGRTAGLVAEFRVNPFGAATALAQATVYQRLGRAGLRHMLGAVDAVMVEVVGAAERRWANSVETLTEDLSVRVVCPPGAAVLVVEIHETCDISDIPVSDALRRICNPLGGKVTRFRAPAGGTVTRCELVLPPAAADPSRADAETARGPMLALDDTPSRLQEAATEGGGMR